MRHTYILLFYNIQGNSGQLYVHNYGETPYSRNQFNTLYEKSPFDSYEKYNQDQPRFPFDSIDTYVTSSKFNVPYSTTNQPRLPYGSVENFVTPSAPGFLYSSVQPYAPPSNPQISYGSPETYVSSIKPQNIFYGSTEGYSAATDKPQSLYGLTGTYSSTTIKPEFSYGSTESYTTTSKPQFFYSSTESYPSTSKPQYPFSSTQSYATTSKPQFSYSSPQFFYSSTESYPSTNKPQYSYSSTESYATTSKPQFSYGPYGVSESYPAAIKPQFTHDRANTYVVPNQPSKSFNFDYNKFIPVEYNRFDGPLGILYHQQHESETGPKYHNGVLLHQQNNFRSIPVNQNYDSHKNDVQYPPLKDYETYSTTQRPLNKLPSTRLYSESYNVPSNIYSGPSIPYPNSVNKNSYSILEGANEYDSHKVNEQYQASYNFETYSTTQKPIIKYPELPTYSQSNFYLKPTSKPFEDYSHERSHSNLNEESKLQYSTINSPYISSSPLNTDFNNGYISSTTQHPVFHDTGLYKEKFKTQFNFEDYLAKISSEKYPSTTPVIDYTPSIHGNSFAQTSSAYSSTTPKPTVFYYSSPSPSVSAYKETHDIPSYSSTPKAKEFTKSYSSSLSYPVTTEKSTDYKLPVYSTHVPPKYNPTVSPSAYTPTFKPTVDYYSPSTTVTNDDSAFVKELISKLSKTPISTTYSSSTPKPLYGNYLTQPTGDYISPNDSFDIDEYIAKLSESIENSTPKPLYTSTSYKPYVVPYKSNNYVSQPLPTSVYLSTTEKPNTFDQESYSAIPVQSTTCKPEASLKISLPKDQYLPSFESVYSARPPVTYTQRPEPLPGYSSTASDLINYYHNVHSSLDSAYRSPLPRYYSPPIGNSYFTNYTLPREYEKDAGHNVHEVHPAYPLKPIIVEPVSPELNAEFERYYTAGIRTHLKSEENGKVLVVGDTNPLLVGKLGAQCDCVKKNKPKTVSTTTRTVIESDEDDDVEKTLSIKAVETKTKVVLEEVKKPSNIKLCTRPGLFRDPKQCNKFYSCNWDKWTQKYQISDFKCPIHLAFDENLSACNWPSKGPACSHDTLINYGN